MRRALRGGYPQPPELSTVRKYPLLHGKFGRQYRDMDFPEPVTGKDALAAGFTQYELNGAGWERLRRGVYLPAGQSAGNLTVLQRHVLQSRAAASASSNDAVISHVSAAAAHGLPIWAIPLKRVHLSRNRRSGARSGPQIVLHAAPFDGSDVVSVAGLRVTSVARTVVNVARTVPFEQAVVVGDAALQLRKTTVSELADQLEQAARRPGAAGARRVLRFLDGRAESPGESRSRVAMSRARLPTPELQAEVFDERGRLIARVDFLFPELGVIGEFDGLVKYGRDLRGARTAEEVLVLEKEREDALRALGWMVVRWVWKELGTQRWFDRLAAAAEIGRRSQRLGSWRPTTSP
ncbi:MAG TPA: hypothetical protein VIW24_02855 [Aldersonia sp.]